MKPPRAAILACLLLTLGLWWWPNRPQGADVPMPTERFNSVSFAPFRDGQSPLRERFPTAAEVDADMRLVAPRVRAIRTYANAEAPYDTAEIAARHGLRVWQGAWLGRDPARNEIEVAGLIASANRHPETIERVVVGNEVLLRRDLPVTALAQALDRVRAAVRQPVTYADVWEFWERNPSLAAHVDIVTIHILPYWEDDPTNIDTAIAHVAQVVRDMRRLFPDKPIAIGEVGWPSRGRWREDAAPSRVNQALFLRRFAALAAAENLDYNIIEAFDQGWKYKLEGTVGAAWGLWTADRAPKFPLTGGVSENPAWGFYAGAAMLLSLAFWRGARDARMVALSFALGNALAFAWCGGVPYAFDEHLQLAVAVNLAAQGGLAWLMLRRAGLVLAGAVVPPPRNAADTLTLFRGRWRDLGLDDVAFLFLGTALVLQVLLLIDPRYRDPPLATFAVPVVVVLARWLIGDLPRDGGGRAELLAGGGLLLTALAWALTEHPVNREAMLWTLCAVVLAAPALARMRQGVKTPPEAGQNLPSGR
ncbi:glycoside hydrolase [Humitalea sp. 24SJ18S-53]|uniref:glycoside hydrolase family 17 protein n=1 Tax=Humitalea sp. 24SJ18S-53 TaxID=3422307 RepID=UPI003D67E09D